MTAGGDPAVTPSPNIWRSPAAYETLNRAADPDRLVPALLDRLLEQHGPGTVTTVVDVGCGSGFHLPMLAARARRVVGVEPHPGLVALARRRVASTRLQGTVAVRRGTAAALPVPDDAVDVVFSHWAYFFGPGSEPGLEEADRVLRPGGLQVVVDLDVTAERGYARWFTASGRGVRADRVAGFFDGAGPRAWHAHRLPVVWRFANRDDLAAVLAIEFPPAVARRALAETIGATVAVPTVVRWRRRQPSGEVSGARQSDSRGGIPRATRPEAASRAAQMSIAGA